MRIKALFATRASYTWTCLAVALGTTLFYALRKGQDANWDQLNYHLAIPFLLLRGTFWDSIAPSGIQTYLNPLILIPQYLVIRALPPLAAVAAIVLVQSMAFVIAARICLRITGPDPSEGGYLTAFLGFMLCLTSPMALSEAGTTIVDLTDAIPVLLAYLLLLTRDDASAPRHACLAAGLLLGLSAGLKLTNMTFVIGAPAFFLAGSAPPRRRIAGVTQLMLGAAIGFLSVAGWWHIALWRRFHNPIFPYANNIFRSPDYPMVAQRDVRFLPTSAWDIVRYPYHWLVGTTLNPGLRSAGSETDPKDARFALALAGAPIALAMVLFRRPRGRALDQDGFACARPSSSNPSFDRVIQTSGESTSGHHALMARPETGLLLACAIGYLVWLFTFGILRYLIPVEVLCGAVMLVLTGWVITERWRTRFLLLLVIAVVARMHVASWQRVPWQPHWATTAETQLALHGKPLVFLTFAPSAFVALSLPANARYVDLDCGQVNLCGSNETTLTRQLRTELAAVPPDTLYAVIPSTSAPPLDAPAKLNLSGLATYGLRLGTQCQPLPVAAKTYLVCEVLRAPSHRDQGAPSNP